MPYSFLVSLLPFACNQQTFANSAPGRASVRLQAGLVSGSGDAVLSWNVIRT
jgi:hypothetical protein